MGSIPCWGISTNTDSDDAVSCELIVVDVCANECICVSLDPVKIGCVAMQVFQTSKMLIVCKIRILELVDFMCPSPGRNKGQKCETRTPRNSNIVNAYPNHRRSSTAKKD